MFKIISIIAEEDPTDSFEEAVIKTNKYKKAGHKNLAIYNIFTKEIVYIYKAGKYVYKKPKTNLENVIKVIADGQCGQYITYTLDELGVLRLSGKGQTFNFNKEGRYDTETNAPWNHLKYNILKIVVEEGITKLGDCIFANCLDLEEVILPDTLTEISDDVFYNCTNLKEINIPKRTKIKGTPFKGCIRLRKVIINLVRQDYYTTFN